jgi:hypothetical protein
MLDEAMGVCGGAEESESEESTTRHVRVGWGEAGVLGGVVSGSSCSATGEDTVGVGAAMERFLVWSGVGVIGMCNSLEVRKRFQNRTTRVAVPVTWCQSETALGRRTVDSGWWTVDGGQRCR